VLINYSINIAGTLKNKLFTTLIKAVKEVNGKIIYLDIDTGNYEIRFKDYESAKKLLNFLKRNSEYCRLVYAAYVKLDHKECQSVIRGLKKELEANVIRLTNDRIRLIVNFRGGAVIIELSVKKCLIKIQPLTKELSLVEATKTLSYMETSIDCDESGLSEIAEFTDKITKQLKTLTLS